MNKLMLALYMLLIPFFGKCSAIEMHVDNIVLFSRIAQRAYKEADFDKEAKVKSAEEDFEGISWDKKFFGGSDDRPSSLGTVWKSRAEDQTVIVSFRGSYWLQDWEEDFDIKKVPSNELSPDLEGFLHRGFLKRVNGCYEEIVKIIHEFSGPGPVERDIFFIGHSLGGAEAMLAGLKTYYDPLVGRRSSKIKIVGFSAPRVGDDGFVKSTGGFPRTNLLNFTTVYDLVPRVPPAFLGFKDIGITIQNGAFLKLFPDKRPLTLDAYSNLPLFRVSGLIGMAFFEGSISWMAGLKLLGEVMAFFHAIPGESCVKEAFLAAQSAYYSEDDKSLSEIGKFSWFSAERNPVLRFLGSLF